MVLLMLRETEVVVAQKKSIVVFSLILDPDGPQDTTTENKPLLTSINKQKAPPNPHVGTWHYFLFRGW